MRLANRAKYSLVCASSRRILLLQLGEHVNSLYCFFLALHFFLILVVFVKSLGADFPVKAISEYNSNKTVMQLFASKQPRIHGK